MQIYNTHVMDNSQHHDGWQLKLGEDCEMSLCDFVYEDHDDLFFHGFIHFGIEGLKEFALRHKQHKMMPFDMTA